MISGERLDADLGNVLLSFTELLNISDPGKNHHHFKTAYIGLEIGKEMQLRREEMEDLFSASLLHDIGAICMEASTGLYYEDIRKGGKHCEIGEILIREAPCCSRLAEIIRYHRTSWEEMKNKKNERLKLISQIIYLSDFVSELIVKGEHILNYSEEIRRQVLAQKRKLFKEEVVDSFLKVSKVEVFWFELTSSRIYSRLLREAPYKGGRISLKEFASIAKLMRHIIDYKSRFTAAHTAGVAVCAKKISKLLGLSEVDAEMIGIAGDLHDIGKLSIPNEILEKEVKLTKNEFNIIKKHPYYTYRILDTIKGIERIRNWAAFHHEKLTGKGYPFGLGGDALDTGARIVAIADMFVALVEDRPYRKGMSRSSVINILNEQGEAGSIDKKISSLVCINYDEILQEVMVEQREAVRVYKDIRRTLDVWKKN